MAAVAQGGPPSTVPAAGRTVMMSRCLEITETRWQEVTNLCQHVHSRLWTKRNLADVMKIEIKIFIDSAGFVSLFNSPRKHAFGDF